jgi:hypothetical protein
VDRVETKILVAVAAKSGENPDRRMGQGSSAMFVSRGSVGPKTYPKWSTPNGKQVNIPVPFSIKTDASGYTEHSRQGVQAPKPAESRNGENQANA